VTDAQPTTTETATATEPSAPPAEAPPASTPEPDSGKTRAQRLAQRQIQPPVEAVKKCRWCGAGRQPRYRRGDHLGFILLRRGELDVHKVRASYVLAESGAYIVEGSGFLVTKTIPKGTRISFWPEGDPEPFTARKPLGYGSGYLARILGGTISHALRGTFSRKGEPLSPRARLALLIGGLLVLAGIVFVWIQRHKGG
jgi:hypothetical protein